ncbi:hypothetical protein [Yersinia pestis]|uniref:hypothetical protein n=1 Tax=Yersinia pestis TaxID=632 RepID=UPI000169AB31|nr:hypothetical protein [Yersinia pestis]
MRLKILFSRLSNNIQRPGIIAGLLLCPENPQLGWGFSKAFSFGSVIKTPFDLLKQFAVWQLQMFNKKSKGGPNEG